VGLLAVVSVDPGSVRLGLGWILDPTLNGTIFGANAGGRIFSPPSLLAVVRAISATNKLTSGDMVVVVEDYVGSGPRDRESVSCLKQIGALEFWCLANNISCVLHQPSQRKKSLAWAYLQLHKPRTSDHDPDDVSALAHAKSFWDSRVGVQHGT